MVSTDQYRYVETMKGKHCDIKIYVNDNADQKEYEEKVRAYLEKIYLSDQEE